MSEPIHIISLGAGVQSSTMALMAAHGEITPEPTCAIFADTRREPAATYRHLDWLERELPFPVHRVSAGDLGEALLVSARGGDRTGSHARPPVYIKADDGTPGGMVRRQCTGDFKIDPIRRKVRELVGLTRKKSPAYAVVSQWIGISTDEIYRVKDSREAWQQSRYPLIETRMSRGDCIEWLKRHGYPIPPKSACVFCPYSSDAQWRNLRQNDAEGWAHAVEVDSAIRKGLAGPGLKGTLFLHKSLVPLDQVVFLTAEDRGQLNMFNNECEGMCGV